MAMIPLRTIFFSSPVLLLIIATKSLAQPDLDGHYCYNEKGNYSANSPYQTNLNTLLSSLFTTNGNGYGFYNSSSPGNSTNQVFATGLCSGDLLPDTCRSCLSNSSHQLTKLCPNQKEALGFYANCMLRYSNRSLYGVNENSPILFYKFNVRNVSSSEVEVERFFNDLITLLNGLTSEAAAGGSLRKFAANYTVTYKTIYALAQCTPDLSKAVCTDCLLGAIEDIRKYSYGKEGAKIVKPNCIMWYEVYRFYELQNVAPLPSSPPQYSTLSAFTTTNS